MDVQFYGGNCIVLSGKDARIVIDDNLAALGLKPVTRDGDVALFTAAHDTPKAGLKLVIDRPGEYEIANVSVIGVPARNHIDEDGKQAGTMFKVTAGDIDMLFCGHVFPEISEKQLEGIGTVDVMFVPVGGNGYTLDPTGALQLIKEIEPKLVVPTHYADKAVKYEVPQQSLEDALKGLGMEPRETVTKLKLKGLELADVTQLLVLERS